MFKFKLWGEKYFLSSSDYLIIHYCQQVRGEYSNFPLLRPQQLIIYRVTWVLLNKHCTYQHVNMFLTWFREVGLFIYFP